MLSYSQGTNTVLLALSISVRNKWLKFLHLIWNTHKGESKKNTRLFKNKRTKTSITLNR